MQKDLKVFLKQYENVPAVAVNWQMFGTSGVKSIPKNKLMIEMLVKQSVEKFEKNEWVKCIVRPKFVKKCINAHLFHYVGPKSAVNSNFDPVRKYITKNIVVNKIRINHYYTRDNDHLVNVKTPRRLKLSIGYQAWLDQINQMNEVYSDHILQFVPELRSKMCFD